MASYKIRRSFHVVSATLFILALCAALTPHISHGDTSITITSDTLNANSKDNTVLFKGNVVAEYDFTICADELLVSYRDGGKGGTLGEGRGIESIKAMGNVRMLRDGAKAKAAEALYDHPERSITFSGGAEVFQCNDTVRGERITLNIDDGSAMVEASQEGTSGGGGRVRAVIFGSKGGCKDLPPPEDKDEDKEISGGCGNF